MVSVNKDQDEKAEQDTDNEPSAFERFESLAKKLFQIPKHEVDTQRKKSRQP
jgi:hypothetical protein